MRDAERQVEPADMTTVLNQIPRSAVPMSADAGYPFVSVVIPTYNEQRRLPATLEAITDYFSRQSYPWELVVSDDGSRDETRSIAHQFAERWPQIRVLSGSVNRGKGAAVRRGVLAAQGRYVLFSDADLATPIEDIELLLPALENDIDVAVGSRAMPETVMLTKQPMRRQIMGKVFRRLVRRLALGGIRDTQCGFKMFRAPVARHIFAQMVIESFAFDVEALLLADTLGYRLQEIGVTWQERGGSTVSPIRDSWRMLRDIYRLRHQVQRRLKDGLQSVPTDNDRCVALIELQDATGKTDLPLETLFDNEHRPSDTVLLQHGTGGALVATFGRRVREVREAATELASDVAAVSAAEGQSSVVTDSTQVLPLATPVTWLRTQQHGPMAVSRENGLLASLRVQEEAREADVRAFEERRQAWQRRRRVLRPLIVLNLVGVIWWLDWLFNYGHAANGFLYSLLVAAEGFGVLQVLGYWFTIWFEREPERKRTRVPGRVDVFIATYNESLDIVEQTVRAAIAMQYPHRTYVLDDGNRAEMGAMVERLGARWITRPNNDGAKAGNINHALTVTDGDFFAVFDADHVPHPDFLTRMMPFMEDPRMGFVQAPQYYANRDETYVAGGAMDQQEIFFGPICRGKDGLGAVFCCGTNMVIRREAILDVGGFRQQSIIEDAATSLDLHEHGWKSRYVPERLAEGLAPEDLGSYISQQRRWARGNLEMLFHYGILRRNMPLQLRLQYVWSSVYYLTGITSVVYLLLPLLFLLFGIQVVGSNSGDFIGHFFPYIFVTIFILTRSCEGRLTFRAMQLSYGLFPVFLGATASAISGRRIAFHVTSKERSNQSFYHLVIPQIIVITVLLVGIAVGFAHYSGARTITNSCWALFDIVLLSAIVRAGAPSRVEDADVLEDSSTEARPPARLTA